MHKALSTCLAHSRHSRRVGYYFCSWCCTLINVWCKVSEGQNTVESRWCCSLRYCLCVHVGLGQGPACQAVVSHFYWTIWRKIRKPFRREWLSIQESGNLKVGHGSFGFWEATHEVSKHGPFFSLARENMQNASIPVSIEPSDIWASFCSCRATGLQLWSSDQQTHLGTLGMEFSGPAPDLLSQNPLAWGPPGCESLLWNLV